MSSQDSTSRNWHQPTVWETEIRPLLPASYQEAGAPTGRVDSHTWHRGHRCAPAGPAGLRAVCALLAATGSLGDAGRPGVHLGPGLEQAHPPLDRLGPVVARRPGAAHELRPSWASAAPAHPPD